MKPVEVKVKGAVWGTLGASLALALLNGLAANNALLSGLPAWSQFLILTVLPPLITFFSGYVTPSSTSRVSDKYVDSGLH